MCGRFFVTNTPAELERELGLEGIPEGVLPRYNIAPTQEVLALVLHEGRPLSGTIRWGLIPHWMRRPTNPTGFINARAETIRTKPSFRESFERRRCLIIASGFYEWRETSSGNQPFAIWAADRRPLTLAGVWDRWRGEDGRTITSCAIVTREATEELAPIHHRMPLVVLPEERETWLDHHSAVDDLESILEIAPQMHFEYYPVSRLVNSARNEMAECLDPLSEALGL